MILAAFRRPDFFAEGRHGGWDCCSESFAVKRVGPPETGRTWRPTQKAAWA